MMAKLFGHRGALGERPENTLEGFRHALAHGVAGIETDIVLTRDLVPVLHHDLALADGQLIRSLDLNQLPPSVPTLAEALAAAPEIEWLLEIKTDPRRPGESHPPALVAALVLAELAPFDWARLRVCAFEWEVLREFARRAPDLKRTAITGDREDLAAGRYALWGDGFEGLDTPDAVAASGADGWAAYHARLGDDEIGRARSLGLEVFACILNDEQDFRRLSPLVDGIVTDFPERLAVLTRESLERGQTTR